MLNIHNPIYLDAIIIREAQVSTSQSLMLGSNNILVIEPDRGDDEEEDRIPRKVFRVFHSQLYIYIYIMCFSYVIGIAQYRLPCP